MTGGADCFSDVLSPLLRSLAVSKPPFNLPLVNYTAELGGRSLANEFLVRSEKSQTARKQSDGATMLAVPLPGGQQWTGGRS